MKTTRFPHLFGLALAMVFVTAGLASADTLSLVTSQAAQNSNDSVAWTSLGGDGTIVGSSFNVNSNKGTSAAVSLTGASSIVSVVCSASPCSWTGAGFIAGARLLWASDAANGGNGPVTVTFAKGVSGGGALIQADGPSTFVAQIQAYSGTSLLGSFTVGSSTGNAVYIGVNDQSGANITSLVFSLASCGTGSCTDFAVETVWLNTGGTGAGTSISGQISSSSGQLLQGVTVTLTPGGTTATDSSGNYSFTGLTAGTSYTVTPSQANVQFIPASQTFASLSGNQVANFGALLTNRVALLFVPVTPCRVVDTRVSAGPFGGPIMSGGSTRSFAIPGGPCGVPASASAYSLNVTVVPAEPLNFLTLWQAGAAQPRASTLNSDGRTKANAAIIPAGTGGVSVYVTNTTQVILDIDGYFAPQALGGLEFYPLAPCRVVDTRRTAAALGGPYIPAAGTRSFPVQSSACSIPPTAQAYSLNYTAIPKTSLQFITTWPAGSSKPRVSTLNAVTGTVTANAAIVPAGTNGDVSVYASDATDLIIDVNGYFAPPVAGGLSLYTSIPCRIADTRQPAGTLPVSGTTAFNVTGSLCGVPAAAKAYVLNATAVPPAALGWLTLWPEGAVRPVASTLNAYDGAITSNMAIVPTTNGLIDVFAANLTYEILDISSFFAP